MGVRKTGSREIGFDPQALCQRRDSLSGFAASIQQTRHQHQGGCIFGKLPKEFSKISLRGFQSAALQLAGNLLKAGVEFWSLGTTARWMVVVIHKQRASGY